MGRFAYVALHFKISESEFNFHFINILSGFDNLCLKVIKDFIEKTSYEKVIGS